MIREWEKPDRVINIIFLAMNGFLWIGYGARLLMRWQSMPHMNHFWAGYLAIAFPLLWHSLLKDRSSVSSLMGATLVFLGVTMASAQLF